MSEWREDEWREDCFRIYGADGKKIKEVYHHGLGDCTTIVFTDGTSVSFNSEDEEWTLEVEE
jgi:hypothetical protein